MSVPDGTLRFHALPSTELLSTTLSALVPLMTKDWFTVKLFPAANVRLTPPVVQLKFSTVNASLKAVSAEK